MPAPTPEKKMEIINKTYKFPWIPCKFTNASFVVGQECFVRYAVEDDAIVKPTNVIDDYLP